MDDKVLVFAAGLLVIVFIVGVTIFVSSIKWADKPPEDARKLTESKQLHFAAVTLTGLGLIFLLSMAMYYWAPSDSKSAKEIFDACKTIIPPIITLILGYYFGREKKGGQTTE